MYASTGLVKDLQCSTPHKYVARRHYWPFGVRGYETGSITELHAVNTGAFCLLLAYQDVVLCLPPVVESLRSTS